MKPADLRELFQRDRFRAHEILFARRHRLPFAGYHRDLVADFWSDAPRSIVLAFRGSGKSTLIEEDIALAACEGAYRNILIVGSSERRAAERLAAIANEIANNEQLGALYGEQRAEPWTQIKIVLANGGCVQAMGRDQDVRGIKHLDWRPDLLVLEDFEDKDAVQTPEGRRKTLRWLLAELLPASDPNARVRVRATPMDAESVPILLVKHAGWPVRRFAITYCDADGIERASWPESMPLERVEAERATYALLGERDVWEREYMVNPVSAADRVFHVEHIRIEPQIRTWQAVYAMIDPARSVGRKSATTGWAVWSWVRNRLIVWEAGAKFLLPDEIVDLAFRIGGEFAPVEIGVEEDGLSEWLAQPIRQEQLRRRVTLPYRGVRAPRGKMDFIRGLQPFFAAGECVWACDLPELREQLLQFPTGRIDAPNALAYALTLRPGRLVYEGFNPHVHVAAVEPAWARPCYLAANAAKGAVAAALVQLVDGQTLVLGDWVVEGDPGDVLEGMAREAALVAPRFTLVAGDVHFQQWANVGLIQAARRLGLETRRGGDPRRGREFLRNELARSAMVGSAFAANPAARWTLNALAGGYSYPVRDGILGAEPVENRYRVLMEGVETLCGLLSFGLQDFDEAPNLAIDARGRRYLSAMPARGRA
jgi:hypothetical protein